MRAAARANRPAWHCHRRRQPRLPRVMTRIGVDQDVSILKFIHHAAYASKRIEALKLLLTNK
jgi:hypothetical protein